MPTFAEDLLLLALDDEGEFLPVPQHTLRYALAGAALMDLAFMDRIDTDPKHLMIVNLAPTANPMLDRALKRLAGIGPMPKTTRLAMETLSEDAGAIREWALGNLIERGILERVETRFLWVRSTAYATADDRAERDAKLRIMDVLLSDAPPHPRDVALICLVDACALMKEILSRRELARVALRIEQLRRMDLIGQAITALLDDMEREFLRLRAMVPHY